MNNKLEDAVSSSINLSEARVAPLYRDFSPAERERIFQAWVSEMSVDEVVELQEVNDTVFENCRAAWKLLITEGGDPRRFTDVYRLLLEETEFPDLDLEIQLIWEKYQEPDWVREQNALFSSTGL